MARWLLRFSVVFIVALPALSGEPWDEPAFSTDPQDLLTFAARSSAQAEEGAVMLFMETEVRVEAGTRLVQRRRLLYRVDSDAVVPVLAFVDVPWRPWYQARPRIKARVVSKDGSVHHLNPDDLGEYSAGPDGPDQFGDTQALRGPLPAMAAGAVVEEEYVVEDTAAFFEPGIVWSTRMGSSLPVLRTRLILDFPDSMEPRYITRLLPDVEVSRTEADGRVRIVFERGPLTGLLAVESFLPRDVPALPLVGFTTVPDWNTVAAAYEKIVDEQLEGNNVAKLVGKSLRGVDSREEKVARLLQVVQKRVRYSGVEFGAQAIVPSPPRTTLERGFGDCKDKSVLLVAMLREAGLEADLALLAVEPGLEPDPELPGLDVFNHAIVRVAGDPPIWIDPAGRYARAGELPLEDQGRLALIIDAATTGLTETPVERPADSSMIQMREVFLQRTGGARLVETLEWHGAFEQMYREFYGSLTDAGLLENFESYTHEYFGASEMTSLEHSEVADLDTPLSFRVEMTDVNFAETTPTDAAVLVPAGPLLDALPAPFFVEEKDEGEGADDLSRKNDLVLPHSHVREWRYTIHSPPGYALSRLPDEVNREFGPARLRQTYSLADDGVVHATYRFDVGRSRYTGEEVRAAARGIRDFLAGDADQIEFYGIGAQHLAAGRVKEALAEFQRLAGEYPDEALYRAQVSRSLIAAGLGEAAREEARRATELQPGSAEAYKALGLALAHDQLGRKHVRGFDLEGAEAAFRKAKELAPDDFEARGELAILLEFDEEGDRYGSAANLDSAIAEYRALAEELEADGLNGNLLIVLLRAGRYEEARTLARKEPYAENAALSLLAATALIDGPDAAIREAGHLPDSTRYGEYLFAAAEELVLMRRYTDAAALMAAGSKGGAGALERMARADMLRQIRRHEDQEYSREAPKGLLGRFFLAAFGDGDQDLLELWASPLQGALGAEETRQLVVAADVLRRMARRSGLSMDMVTDFTLSLSEFTVEGDGPNGHIVRMEEIDPQGGASLRFSMGVVRENDRLVTIGFVEFPASIGAMILHWLEREEMARAKYWLDLVHEETSSVREDDPLSGSPFRRLWTPGAADDLPRMRYAAASLMTTPPFNNQALEILQQGLESDESDELKTDLRSAMLGIAMISGDHDVGARTARELLERFPQSDMALAAAMASLAPQGKWDEIEEIARRRHETDPASELAEYAMAEVALGKGNDEAWARFMRDRIKSGKGTAVDYNNLAWYEIGKGRFSQATLRLAQRAAALTQYTELASLHTLAAVYAEMDRPVEAREVLMRIVDSRERGELNEPEDWYIFGRIAESYGVIEAAQEAYLKVTRSERSVSLHLTSHDFAQRRLDGLNKVSEAGSAATGD